MTVAARKETLRKESLARRSLARAAVPDAAQRLVPHFLDFIPLSRGAIVSAYVAIGEELDPTPLVEALRARGHAIALPRVAGKGKPLALHLYPPGALLLSGPFGLSEPASDWPQAVPDIVIVPLLAFDGEGNRLGYGAGFYDRTLEGLRRSYKPLAVGYAFSAQEVEHVPHQDGDQRLDWVVTETGARKFEAFPGEMDTPVRRPEMRHDKES